MTSAEARTSPENVTSRFCNHFSVIQSHYAWKCVLTILKLNWNQRLGHKKTKLNICYHMLTSSTHLQNWSFHVVERTRTSAKCQKMKYARAKRANILFFTVKYANLWDSCCHRRRGCLKLTTTNAWEMWSKHQRTPPLHPNQRARKRSQNSPCNIFGCHDFSWVVLHIWRRTLRLHANAEYFWFGEGYDNAFEK